MKTFKYKHYDGSIEASIEDNCLHGKILFIADLVTYEASTVEELRKEFESAVDDYLKTCEEVGIEAKKPFKGSFNIRIGKELHEKAAQKAASTGKTLNEYIKEIVQRDTASHMQ
ncbi:MAG: type II toxin-antitoxin system HicB family antitoxin [Gammaproteobacteria bacterium]